MVVGEHPGKDRVLREVVERTADKIQIQQVVQISKASLLPRSGDFWQPGFVCLQDGRSITQPDWDMFHKLKKVYVGFIC